MQSYAISPGSGKKHEILSQCANLAAAGITFLQLREKERTDDELLEMAQRLVEICKDSTTRVLVNDRLDIAVAAGADGVHAGTHSLAPEELRGKMPQGMLLAVSTHNKDEIAAAEAARADLITFSPVYETISKPMTGPPQGIDSLKAVCRETSLPVFALGGVTREKLPELGRSGCAGVAAISMFFNDPAPGALIDAIAAGGNHGS